MRYINALQNSTKRVFLSFCTNLEGQNIHLKKKRIVTELSTPLALIEALGNCKSGKRDLHLFFFIFIIK